MGLRDRYPFGLKERTGSGDRINFGVFLIISEKSLSPWDKLTWHLVTHSCV